MKNLKIFATQSDYEAYIADKPILPNVSYIKSDESVGFAPKYEPFYIEAIEDLRVQFSGNDLQYSLDNINWNRLPNSTETPTIRAGEKVYFKAEGLVPQALKGIGTFSITSYCNVGGNILSLLFGDYAYRQSLVGYDFAFTKLLERTPIIDASLLLLPSDYLSYQCYRELFSRCSDLLYAPKLPAMNLAAWCYEETYAYCSNLETPSELPAKVLVGYCYCNMYRNSGIKVSPILSADTLVDGCYNGIFMNCPQLQKVTMTAKNNLGAHNALSVWVSGVPSSGTFVKAAGVTIPTGESGIPSGWTIEEVAV